MSYTLENLADETIVGDPAVFAIGYAFLGTRRTTEVSMFAGGANLLGFTQDGERRTTRWPHLEGLVAWLRDFALTMREDPYPVEAEGEYAAQRDAAARTFESDDEGEMDAYYDTICDWAYAHSWHSESGGAILSDMLFEYRDGMVELSWDNRDAGDGVKFDFELGGVRVDAASFRDVVLKFSEAYERYWGIRLDDERTWVRKA